RLRYSRPSSTIVWDLDRHSQQTLWECPQEASALAFSANEERLFVGCDSGKIFDIDVVTGKSRLVYERSRPLGIAPTSGNELVVVYADAIVVLDLSTLRAREITHGSFYQAELSPDGQWVAARGSTTSKDGRSKP